MKLKLLLTKGSSILLTTMLSLLTVTSFAQIEVDEPSKENKDSKTQGFFVNGGKQKLDAIECYNFKDLIVSFDIKKEHFVCDQLSIEFEIGNENKNDTYRYVVDQDEFSSLFEGKEYAYFKVFSSEDMEEESRWYTTHYSPNSDVAPTHYKLTRSRLQHTKSKKHLENSTITVKIYCGKITGEKEVSKALSDGRVVTNKYKTWKWEDSSTFSIPLKNRIFINIAKFKLLGYPKKPVENGACYE
jgi:hypothetical protein